MMFTFYDAETGEIKFIYSGNEVGRATALFPELSHLPGMFNFERQYIFNGEPVDRPAQATVIDKTTLRADAEDWIAITGVPDNAQFKAVNQDSGDAVEGPIQPTGDTFTSGIAGRIKLRIEAFPFLPWEAVVHAV